MPSEKILMGKQQVVAGLKDKLSSAVSVVIVDYKGITVAQDTALRKELREAGVEYTVVKNTLLGIAAKEVGLEGIVPSLKGTTALAVCNDHVAAAKILCKFADNSKGKFNVKCGDVEGKVLDADGVKALAKLPTREVLLTQVLFALNGNLRGLAVALNAIAEKQSA